MPVLDYAIEDYILTFSPQSLLKDIIIYMGQVGKEIYIDNGAFVASHSLHTYRNQVKVAARKSLPTLNQIAVTKGTAHHHQVALPIECIYVVEESQLIGILTVVDVIRFINSGRNLATIKIAEVMQEPVIILERDFDAHKSLVYMQQHGVRHLAIVNDRGQLIGIVTPESLALGLQKELVKIKDNLQLEIAQRCSLEGALRKAEEESNKRIVQATDELVKANKLLQRGISDRIATEAQLLQTTSDLQEIFQAFPDLYFRLDSDGTILSYYTKEISELYLPPEDFLGRRIQDILPNNVGSKFLEAILQVQQTNSVVAIEYSLPISGKEESFEARLLPSIQQHIITIIRNISVQKQTQEALQKTKAELEIRVEERTKELRVSEERYIRAINAGKVGIWEWNIKTNEIYIDPNLQAMLGYPKQETSKYYNDWLNFVHPDDVEFVKNALNAYLNGITPKYEIEHRMLNKDGSCIWFLSRGTLVYDSQGNKCCIAGSNTDITARTQAENKLKISLKEKEILLKEIHHRVKNNLQIISSLLRLQTRYISDSQTLEVFQDSHNRVRAMAIIHENLYQTHDLTKIEFADYVRSLTNNLLRSYGVISDINIYLNINQNISLKIDTVISCGLIINELVSNSIKHAFLNSKQGEIHIELLEINQDQYSLIVRDNGVGLSKDIDFYKNQSLGLQLIWSLVEQLEGIITFNTSLGTSFTITFSEQN